MFTFAGKAPTLQELHKYVVGKVASQWERLAITLEVDDEGQRIAVIRRDLWGLGSEACCMQALQLWLRGEGRQPVSWKTLIECLDDMEYINLARSIRENLLKKGK